MDIALGDRKNASIFFDRLNYNNNTVIKFFVDCSDFNEWIKRHEERLKNPLMHQSFKTIAQVVEHYKMADSNPFDDEYVIDSANTVQECFNEIIDIINKKVPQGID